MCVCEFSERWATGGRRSVLTEKVHSFSQTNRNLSLLSLESDSALAVL